MKVPIDEVAVIDHDAPVLPAYEAKYRGVVGWFVWCRHCREWHDHGPAEGHREAHCQDQSSPYWRKGYNLAYAGKWRNQPIGSAEWTDVEVSCRPGTPGSCWLYRSGQA